MIRAFWTATFLVLTAGGSWAVYASAQELQDLLTPPAEGELPANQRYQFVDHFFTQNGRQFEVFLRLDRATGQTWRFHASTPTWTPIGEGESGLPASDGKDNRFQLMSHVYTGADGAQQELYMRVDAIDGRSWQYKGMASAWEEIKVEVGEGVDQIAQEPILLDTK